MSRSLSFGRRAKNSLFYLFSVFTTLFALFFLGAIFWELIRSGFAGLDWSDFTENTPPPMTDGGFLNALVGSLIMTSIAMSLATVVGVLVATFLSEFRKQARLGSVVRFLNDILLSAPSIIIGLFIYALLVVPFGGFSGIAGSIALAIVALPMITRTCEDVLRIVPDQLREAGIALGLKRSTVTLRIIYRSARAGMVTAVLLALGRVAGETAPLLFTALNNSGFSANLFAPMPNLPVMIYQFAMSPYENWKELAWAASLLITVFILALNVFSRVIFRPSTSS